jgi:hypothetical protein
MIKRSLGISVLLFLTIGSSTPFVLAEDVPVITKEQLVQMFGKPDLVILDVRLGSDYFSSDLMIKRAVRPDMSAPIWYTSTRYPRENTFVIYCSSPDEEQSVRIAKLLMKGDKDLGHQPCANVYVL